MKEDQPKQPIFYQKELIYYSIVIVAISLLALGFSYLFHISETILDIGNYHIYKDVILPSILLGIIVNISLFVIAYFSNITPDIKTLNKAKNIIPLILLAILGVIAYLAIVVVFSCPKPFFNLDFHFANWIAAFVELIYFYLIIKLYMFNYIESKSIFFEIVRFALVGVIASLFDFATCYIFQYLILKSLNDVWITVISVTMGFLVGVVVNYLCSIYMVFKATTSKDKSRTNLGRFLFFVLAAVGLFIGIGLQYLFYDFLKLDYIVTFIIRTLIVLIWNYLSRKYLIFR